MTVLGDAHADDPENRASLMAAYEAADAPVTLQLGDLGHYDLPTPTYFVAGNNEDLDVVDALREGDDPDVEGVSNLILVASRAFEIGDLKLAGLSGNYAPTQYEKSREELVGARRRHFVESEVEAAMGLHDVDVFLAHEAPHGVLHTDGYDVGCRPMDRILSELEPDLCLVGHHHQHAEGSFGDTRVVCLAPVTESYYSLDPDTLGLERTETPEPNEAER
ncbi:metallophosphoesterase [Halobium salinum]|uniref:Metallophosphoesterase n=1 Tax=Halobium salinum TaxID=1364940 RepID=A0ABD5PA29_9EURY